MTANSTAIRATHLLTNAAWFGGSLMGAVALNPASHRAHDARDQTEVAGAGWERWGPVQGTAIALHLASGLGILADNRRRTVVHRPTRRAVVAKTALTGAALAATAGAWDQGRKRAEQQTPGPDEVDERPQTVHRNLSWLRWAVPVTTGALLVLDAYLGEQQRGPAGLLDRAFRR